MIRLALDFRSLNYSVRTGINIYYLNVLKILAEIKEENSLGKTSKFQKIEIIGFGLDPKVQLNLEKEFPWLANFIDESYSLAEFYNLTFLERKWPFSKSKLNRLINITSWFFNRINIHNTENNLKISHIFQPQIKSVFVPEKANFLVAVHDFFYLEIPNWTNSFTRPNEVYSLVKNNLNKANQIWANSISTANQTASFFPETKDKIKLVYPALSKIDSFDRDNLESSSKVLSKVNLVAEQYFVSISGIEPRKNWVNLLQAWKSLEEKSGWNYKLVLAGRIVDNQYYQDILELVATYELKSIVWFLDISEDEKHVVLSNSVSLLYPSLFEGFGFPILEAWQNGIPAIVGNMGASMEIGKGGVLPVNPLDCWDIASGIELLTLDESFRQELIKNGQKRLQEFNWQEYKSKLEKWIYE